MKPVSIAALNPVADAAMSSNPAIKTLAVRLLSCLCFVWLGEEVQRTCLLLSGFYRFFFLSILLKNLQQQKDRHADENR